MNYTYKLARRLAVSRVALAAGTLFIAACSGSDAPTTTGPGDVDASEGVVVVSPQNPSVTPNEPVRFAAFERLGDGDSVPTEVVWAASGGTIDSSGAFVSRAPGRFSVIARGADRSGRADTTEVVVVGGPVAVYRVFPREASVAVGAHFRFGVESPDTAGTAPAGVTWSATGGSIDANGEFVAGAVPGNYTVVAIGPQGRPDTATVVVSPVTTPPPVTGPDFPNQPTGATRVVEHAFDALNTPLAGEWSAGGGETSVRSEIGPDGRPASVLATRFSASLRDGAAPVTWRAWNSLTEESAARYGQLYVSLRMKIPGKDFQNQQVGTKLWYVGYGNTKQDNAAYLMMKGTGETSLMSAMKLTMYVSGTDDADGASQPISQNVDSRALLTAGEWHNVEVYMDQGDVSQHNGVLRIWVDGVLVTDRHDIKYRDSRHAFTQGFFRWQWTPVWGGVGGRRTREDNILLDHVLVSGK